jgi:hypothetical protein
MGLIPCDEAAHIHTNSLLNLEVWGAAKGRKRTLVDQIWGSAFEKLLQMDTADSKYCQYVQYNVQTAWIFPMQFRTLRREIAFNHQSIE